LRLAGFGSSSLNAKLWRSANAIASSMDSKLRRTWLSMSLDPVHPMRGSIRRGACGSYSRTQAFVFAVPDCVAVLAGRKILTAIPLSSLTSSGRRPPRARPKCCSCHRRSILWQTLRDGRGSRIRTCDLKYPKLPRYQAALYPVPRSDPTHCDENRYHAFKIRTSGRLLDGGYSPKSG
jgi:hypothetical protein